MKKFWLNLIEVVAFIYQIFCVLGMVFSVFVLGIVAFSFNNNSDFAQGFRAGFGSWGKGNTLWLAIAFFVVLFLEALAEFFICRFARGLVRNIKNEIFFANQNLELIRKLLVWVATYTVMTIVLFMMSLNLQIIERRHTTPCLPYRSSRRTAVSCRNICNLHRVQIRDATSRRFRRNYLGGE